MRLLIYLTCIIFTFVSLGGNIYIHTCKDATLFSLYSEMDTKSCPFCEKHHKSEQKKDESCKGECKDSTLKIDQLSDQNFNTSQSLFTQLSPAITPLLWIINFVIPAEYEVNNQLNAYNFSFSDPSPPIFLQNCTFRI